MGNPAGVPRDFEALRETCRFPNHIHLFEQGQKSIGDRPPSESSPSNDIPLGAAVSVSTTCRHSRKPDVQALAALRRRGSSKHQLRKLLLAGPERLGYETPLWTCPRAAHLIEQQFGVHYHEGHVWKLLVGLGWSPQLTVGQARERNEEQIYHWKEEGVAGHL